MTQIKQWQIKFLKAYIGYLCNHGTYLDRFTDDIKQSVTILCHLAGEEKLTNRMKEYIKEAQEHWSKYTTKKPYAVDWGKINLIDEEK